MRVLLRSANESRAIAGTGQRRLREAGRAVFAALRGPDVAAVQQFSPTIGNRSYDDSLNSTGNFESLPPYRTATHSYPSGRMIWGSTRKRRPDATFTRMLSSQGVQSPFTIDTSWLSVGHSDETFHVMPADNEHGWTLMVADPRLAVRLLTDARQADHGSVELFVGKKSIDLDSGERASATRTITEVLGDRKLMRRNAEAGDHIDRIVAVLVGETGLAPDELVRVPVLFDGSRVRDPLSPSSKGVKSPLTYGAYSPGIPNGLSLADGLFAAPDPHGPHIDGRDLYKTATERALAQGSTARVKWVENWDWLHVGGGEVHCGTNALRDITDIAGWYGPQE